MNASDPRFRQLLQDWDFAALSASAETIYGVWPDLTLGFTNLGWTRFAARNNGEPSITDHWPLGRSIMDAIAPPLRPFFSANYARCLAEQRPWEHSYECSSAQVYREFHMLAFPLGHSEGLLVVNSLRRETAHTRTPSPPVESLYRNEHGIVTQCSHCRRVRRVGRDPVWDWVPDWITTCPPRTSHGLCDPCLGFYYSPTRNTDPGFVRAFQTK
jgi:hypothetical protein